MILMQQEQAKFKQDTSSLQESRNKKRTEKRSNKTKRIRISHSIINSDFVSQASGNNLMIIIYII